MWFKIKKRWFGERERDWSLLSVSLSLSPSLPQIVIILKLDPVK